MAGKIIHGYSKRGETTKEYWAWVHMRQRCNNPKSRLWEWYGGRGIKVCPEWNNDFVAFLEHVGKKPSPDLTLDRIDNNGDYEPGNVRWADMKCQAQNKRNPQVPTIIRRCQECGKEYTRPPSVIGFFCGRSCYSKSMLGIKNKKGTAFGKRE